MLPDHLLDKTGAVFALSNQAPKCHLIGTATSIISEYLWHCGPEEHLPQLCIKVSGQRQVQATPGWRKQGWLGISLFQCERDPLGINQRSAIVEGQNRYCDLAGDNCQFLALDVIDFDRFVLEPFELENLADFCAEGADPELVEANHGRDSISFMVVAFIIPKLL